MAIKLYAVQIQQYIIEYDIDSRVKTLSKILQQSIVTSTVYTVLPKLCHDKVGNLSAFYICSLAVRLRMCIKNKATKRKYGSR